MKPMTPAELAAEHAYRLNERLMMMSPDAAPTEAMQIAAMTETNREIARLKKTWAPKVPPVKNSQMKKPFPVVKLDYDEIVFAAHRGIERQAENIFLERKQNHGSTELTAWQKHIDGCLGEFAVAKFLDVPWSGKGLFRGPDVGQDDVRCGALPGYRLILHKEDPDRIFWSAVGLNGTYSIQGWIPVNEGRLPQYWSDPSGQNRPAFFVATEDLYSPWTPPR